MKRILILLGLACIGWALCGATIAIGRKVTSMEITLIVHAIAAPVFFAVITLFYFRTQEHFSALFTASFFLGFVVFMDFFVVAMLIEKDFAMFRSVLGTWLPFFLIFCATFITGTVLTQKQGAHR